MPGSSPILSLHATSDVHDDLRVKMTFISLNKQDGRRGSEADALLAFGTNLTCSASAPVLVMCIVSASFPPLKQISWYLGDHPPAARDAY